MIFFFFFRSCLEMNCNESMGSAVYKFECKYFFKKIMIPKFYWQSMFIMTKKKKRNIFFSANLLGNKYISYLSLVLFGPGWNFQCVGQLTCECNLIISWPTDFFFFLAAMTEVDYWLLGHELRQGYKKNHARRPKTHVIHSQL